METDPNGVTLTLSSDEALVLYDDLARTASANSHEPLVEDQSELRVLWDLEAMLESHLAAVVAPDYHTRLAAARDAIRDVTW